MRSTILRLRAYARPVAFAAAALLAPVLDFAHEIPARVTVLAFVKPEPGRLRVLVRVPLEAMRDIDFPQRGLGYLDLARSEPLARDAATVWIADHIRAFEDGRALPEGTLLATRISLPSDRAFAAYGTAIERVFGAPLPAETDLPWNQAALDAVIDFPIQSVDARFSIDAQFARLGVETTTVLRYVAPSGAVRAYQFKIGRASCRERG